MQKYNFDKYFATSDTKYYEPKIIITIIEDILGKDINGIKCDVDNLNISVNKQEIEVYLDKMFEEENPELKRKLENLSLRKRSNNILELTLQSIKESSQELEDQLSARRYFFEPYTLEYFNRYINIVRIKAKKILSIIEKIVNRNYSDIVDLMVDLDIQLDENGNILRDDIVRLISPFIHNFNELNEKVKNANDLSTYLTFKQTKHSLYRSGCSEDELYPTTSIQVKNLYYDYLPGNILLSANQKEELREKERRSMKMLVKDLLDW